MTYFTSFTGCVQHMEYRERNPTSTARSVFYCSLPFFILAGCSADPPSIELELHLPTQPVGKQRLEIRIDRKPERTLAVKGNVYAVQFDRTGKAVVHSSGFLQQWRKTYLVVDGRRLNQDDDFEILKSGWQMAKLTEKLPEGGVRSKTVEEGSVYWLEIELVPPEDASR